MPIAAKMTVAHVKQAGGGAWLTPCIAQRVLEAWPPADWENDPNVSTSGSGYYGHDYEEGGCCYNEYGILAVLKPGQSMESVKLTPVVSGEPGDPNQAWAAATPSGVLEMEIANPEAWGFFEPGVDYLIRITKFQPTKVRTDGSTDE